MTALTSKGQATIPVKIREHLGVRAGDQVEFAIVDGVVVVRKGSGATAYDLGQHLFGKHQSDGSDLSSRESRKRVTRARVNHKHG